MSEDIEQPGSEVVGAVKKGGGWVVALGILTIILGMVAIAAPAIAGVWVTILVGAVFLVNGLFQVIHGFGVDGWKGKTFTILIGVLTVIAGAIILARPMFGLEVLTLILSVFFLMEGIMTVILAFKVKPEKGWGWALFSGIVSFVLGGLIWAQWPASGLWAVGLLVGIVVLRLGDGGVWIGGAGIGERGGGMRRGNYFAG
ncbi:MAG: HdeD family acid-resistance protein [Verrucomicrobiota bacterium]